MAIVLNGSALFSFPYFFFFLTKKTNSFFCMCVYTHTHNVKLEIVFMCSKCVSIRVGHMQFIPILYSFCIKKGHCGSMVNMESFKAHFVIVGNCYLYRSKME